MLTCAWHGVPSCAVGAAGHWLSVALAGSGHARPTSGWTCRFLARRGFSRTAPRPSARTTSPTTVVATAGRALLPLGSATTVSTFPATWGAWTQAPTSLLTRRPASTATRTTKHSSSGHIRQKTRQRCSSVTPPLPHTHTHAPSLLARPFLLLCPDWRKTGSVGGPENRSTAHAAFLCVAAAAGLCVSGSRWKDRIRPFYVGESGRLAAHALQYAASPAEVNNISDYGYWGPYCPNAAGGFDMSNGFDIILGPRFSRISQPRPHPTRAVRYAILGAHADRVLIGAWNPMF